MKILVTGGAGFIGSHIADAYIKEGHTVVIIDNLSTGDIKNVNTNAIFIKQDITGPEIEDIFKEFKFDVVNHHAAQINVRYSLEDPILDANVNIIGSLNLLRLSAKYKVKRFIFASSGGAIYGEPKVFPITEDFKPEPLSPYGVAKLTVENYVNVFARLYSFDYVILRYSNVYGPRQISKSEAGVISIFINNILENKICFINGDGNQIRDYVYVGDVVRANLLALDSHSDCFNIGTGVETSVNDLLEILGKILNQPIEHQHRAPIPGEVFKNVLDFSKAEKYLNWKPRVPLVEGIRLTYEYFYNERQNKIS
ncbi:MAG: NAD-dependent epimerase/dehydratase family protein [candidate division WOR-3 bacterium]|nr:NAD-dependent epimerase/dehydratase family protein [candidate division WOR-3 bacterium]